MSNALSVTSHPIPTAPASNLATNVRKEPAAPAKPAPSTAVSISKAAIAAAAKEAAETPEQTAQEAQKNDPQALRLQARQAAAQRAYG